MTPATIFTYVVTAALGGLIWDLIKPAWLDQLIRDDTGKCVLTLLVISIAASVHIYLHRVRGIHKNDSASSSSRRRLLTIGYLLTALAVFHDWCPELRHTLANLVAGD